MAIAVVRTMTFKIATKQQLLRTINKLSKRHAQTMSDCLFAIWSDISYDQAELDRAAIALDTYAAAQNNFARLCITQPEP